MHNAKSPPPPEIEFQFTPTTFLLRRALKGCELPPLLGPSPSSCAPGCRTGGLFLKNSASPSKCLGLSEKYRGIYGNHPYYLGSYSEPTLERKGETRKKKRDVLKQRARKKKGKGESSMLESVRTSSYPAMHTLLR